ANPTKKEPMSKIRLLNKRIEHLEEEIETLNNPDSGSDQEESGSQLPKRKTMPFSQFLTNEESLKQLRETAHEAEKMQKQEAQRKKGGNRMFEGRKAT
ncbi:13989_t:CDS:2, partial [Dentiscutata heterogama]